MSLEARCLGVERYRVLTSVHDYVRTFETVRTYVLRTYVRNTSVLQ